VDIVRVHKENFNVYGAWKLWRQLNREGIPVGRDHVARLMPELGLVGTVRGKTWPTSFPADAGQRPADLVDRKFMAVAPNRLWVADLTYVSTWACVAYTAFVTDVFSRSHRAARGRRCRLLGRFSRRLLRQCHGRVRQRSLQDRGHPQARTLAVIRTARVGHRQVG